MTARPAGDHGAPAARTRLVRQLIDTAVADRIVPGAVLTAGIGGSTMLVHTAGNAQDDDSGRRPVSAATIFDLASLTKVVATAPCILLLAASGQLGLDDPAVRYLPSFTGPGKDQVTIRQLLTHTSGLPEHRAYYQYLTDAGQLRAAVLAEPLVAAPGSGCRYSDIGFMVLGQLAEAVCGCGLAEITGRLVCQPLRMTATQFRPPPGLAGQIASTEIVAGAARTGVVHDENAEPGRRCRRPRGAVRHRGRPGPVRGRVDVPGGRTAGRLAARRPAGRGAAMPDRRTGRAARPRLGAARRPLRQHGRRLAAVGRGPHRLHRNQPLG